MIRLRSRFGSVLGPRFSPLVVRTAVTETTNVRPFDEVPGPKPLPFIGNAWRFLPGIGTFNLDDFALMIDDLRQKYGDIIIKVTDIPGRSDAVLVFDPQSVENVFRNEGAYPQRIPFKSMEYFRTDVRKDFFKGDLGVIIESGKKWQNQRSVINSLVLQPRVARQYASSFDKVVKDFVKRMSLLRNVKKEMPDDFNNELKNFTLELISLVTLDTRLGCLESQLDPNSDSQRMINAVDRIFDAAYELDMKPPIWKIISTPTLRNFIQAINTFLEIGEKYVERAREKMRDDLPEESQSFLLRYLKRDPSTKRAVIMATDMMFAGVDTTSTTAAFVLYHLARNPLQQEKLFKEVNSLVSEETLTADVIDSMKYLKACIKEAIRLNPPIFANTRTLQKDIVLNNYLIPKGVEIIMINGFMCRMDKHFPQAKKFIPERWLRGEDSEGCPVQHKAHPYVYLPFSHGPRRCLGYRFANLGLETLVARVIKKYRLEWHYSDLEQVSRFVMLPDGPLRFRVLER